MLKKAIAIAALATAAVFAMPAAANADYVPDENISVTGDPVPGGTVSAGFAAGSFTPGEPLSIAITGEPTPSLAALGVFTGTLNTSGIANGSGGATVDFVLPLNATGAYTVVVTGDLSGNVGIASVSVVPADSGPGTTPGTGPDGLVNTGSTLSAMVIWGGIGALLVGTALVVALTVRRNRAHVDA